MLMVGVHMQSSCARRRPNSSPPNAYQGRNKKDAISLRYRNSLFSGRRQSDNSDQHSTDTTTHKHTGHRHTYRAVSAARPKSSTYLLTQQGVLRETHTGSTGQRKPPQRPYVLVHGRACRACVLSQYTGCWCRVPCFAHALHMLCARWLGLAFAILGCCRGVRPGPVVCLRTVSNMHGHCTHAGPRPRRSVRTS